MRLGLLANEITVLGPGKRLVIWFAGCFRHCENCSTPELRESFEEQEIDIIKEVEQQNLSNIKCVTISGGEPFAQSKDLLAIVKHFRANGAEDILVYTGYTFAELKNMKSKTVDEIIKDIDVLIDGTYIRELDVGQRLQGSSNQVMHIFNSKLKARYNEYVSKGRKVQVFFTGKGMHIAGLMPKEALPQRKVI